MVILQKKFIALWDILYQNGTFLEIYTQISKQTNKRIYNTPAHIIIYIPFIYSNA